jgi:hypothetical protein
MKTIRMLLIGVPLAALLNYAAYLPFQVNTTLGVRAMRQSDQAKHPQNQMSEAEKELRSINIARKYIQDLKRESPDNFTLLYRGLSRDVPNTHEVLAYIPRHNEEDKQKGRQGGSPSDIVIIIDLENGIVERTLGTQ